MLAGCDDLRVRVACPSQEFAPEEMAFGRGRWLSGSRGLWECLTVGAEDDLAIIMLQAPPIGQDVVTHLFSLLPEQHQRPDRQALVELEDGSESHLSTKVLGQPAVIDRLRATLDSARRQGHRVEGLSCYASSRQMAKLAERLGVDLVDTDPHLLKWGTKSGSRQVFRAAGVPHPAGSYHLDRTVQDLASTLDDLGVRFGRGRWMVKLDAGFGSGHGNAVVDTSLLPSPASAACIANALRPCSPLMATDDFLRHVVTTGAVAEQVIPGDSTGRSRSPSALGYLHRGGGALVDFLATHDQITGAAGDFMGCRFPADAAYRVRVGKHARAVFDHLAGLGVTGHVGVDFVAYPGKRTPRVDAVEINLRQTGSTHPRRMVSAVRRGSWTAEGTFVDPLGQQVFYKGTDSLHSSRWAGVSSTALLGALRSAPKVGFQQRTGRGTIPHLWSSLEPYGKIGGTFIGTSAADCDSIESDFVTLLDHLADTVRRRPSRFGRPH
ncbi:hypothetical protein H4696_000677 [Amycolatopsis lexingtonensis]|uniref:IQCH-like ATP-grasp domain-containing protein n=1 Tax=Amycolatopsis lexingtonensis TaxID=218822 RepID=A0ABR9HRL5_9PSEU|nr:hypothetical protein [Amycolatopsis lexingtonensis]MBE1493577.1 hypothetical protein [Amycolatopsis lexingtonensis]